MLSSVAVLQLLLIRLQHHMARRFLKLVETRNPCEGQTISNMSSTVFQECRHLHSRQIATNLCKMMKPSRIQRTFETKPERKLPSQLALIFGGLASPTLSQWMSDPTTCPVHSAFCLAVSTARCDMAAPQNEPKNQVRETSEDMTTIYICISIYIYIHVHVHL